MKKFRNPLFLVTIKQKLPPTKSLMHSSRKEYLPCKNEFNMFGILSESLGGVMEALKTNRCYAQYGSKFSRHKKIGAWKIIFIYIKLIY
ncbi:MAG: hypothetical protein LGB54_05110 [Sulfurovum sp.]|nr:hypothetical protein [Sulfurovum sp.]